MESQRSTYVRVAPSPRIKDTQTPASDTLIQLRAQHLLPRTTQRAKERVAKLKKLHAVPYAVLLRDHEAAVAESLHRLRLVKAVRNIRVHGAGSGNAIAGALCLPLHSCAALPSTPARVLTGSVDGLLTLWDAESCAPLCSQSTYAESHGWGRVRSIAVHPQQTHGGAAAAASSFVFTASMFQHLVRVWRVTPGNAGSCAEDAEALVAAGTAASLQPLTTASTTEDQGGGGVGGLQQLAVDPSGALLAATHSAGVVHVWDARTVIDGAAEVPLRRLYTQDGYETAGATLGVAFHPDGALLTTSDAGGRVVAWDTRSGRLAFHTGGRVGSHLRAASCVAWSPCGVRVASGGGDGVVHLYDARRLTKAGLGPHNGDAAAAAAGAPTQLLGHDDAITSLSFYANPTMGGGRGGPGEVLPIGIVTTSLDHTMRVWDADTGLCVRSLDAGAPLHGHCRPPLPPASACFASSTAVMVVGHSKSWLLYDVGTGDDVAVTENSIVASAHGTAGHMRFDVLAQPLGANDGGSHTSSSSSSEEEEEEEDEMMSLRRKAPPSAVRRGDVAVTAEEDSDSDSEDEMEALKRKRSV
ncbi:U4/U6 small nuclear ribonuclear protein [Novymonas esmeraldas]|uniref:U4/U6 small nuclear ribonuclear protein n=1 Tax=Novymonas esmeraldas TaxID=1808958 RepID=A0AAW0ELA6_9TRYP